MDEIRQVRKGKIIVIIQKFITKKVMKKSVKKLGNYHIYKENHQEKDQICTFLKGRQIQENFQVEIIEIDRKRLNNNDELSRELKRKMELFKVVNHHIFHGCKEVVVTQNHYYIVSERKEQKSLKIKKLNHPGNGKEIIILLRTFRRIFKEMKRINAYHGHLSLESILTGNIPWKCENIGKMELDRFKFVIEILEMKEWRLRDHEWMVYYPPEAFLHNRFSEKTDIWAFGVILYHKIYGMLPWNVQNLNLHEFIHNQVYSDIIFPFREEIFPELKHLIYCCLKPDEDLRFCYQDFLHAEIFESYYFKNLTSTKKLMKSESISSQTTDKTLNCRQNYNTEQKTEV